MLLLISEALSTAGSVLGGLFGSKKNKKPKSIIPIALINQILGFQSAPVEQPGVEESRFKSTILNDLGFDLTPQPMIVKLQDQIKQLEGFANSFNAHNNSVEARNAFFRIKRKKRKGIPMPDILPEPEPIDIEGFGTINSLDKANNAINSIKQTISNIPLKKTIQAEKEIQQSKKEEDSFAKIRETLLSNLGLEPVIDEKGIVTGFTQKITPEEELRTQIENELLNRQSIALKGDLPVAPGLLRDLSKQEETLREQLINQLGQGFETSSPGIEALSNFNLRKNEILEAARRGDIAQAGQLANEDATVASNLLTQKLSNIFNVPGFGLNRQEFNFNKLLSEANILQGQQGIPVEERKLNAQFANNLINQKVGALGGIAANATGIVPGRNLAGVGTLLGGSTGKLLGNIFDTGSNFLSSRFGSIFGSGSSGNIIMPSGGNLLPGISRFIPAF